MQETFTTSFNRKQHFDEDNVDDALIYPLYWTNADAEEDNIMRQDQIDPDVTTIDLQYIQKQLSMDPAWDNIYKLAYS